MTDTQTDGAADEPQLSFTKHTEIRHCLRCGGETWGHDTCPVCRFVLDDDTIDAHAAKQSAAKRRQMLILGGIMLSLFSGIGGAAVGYWMGARSVDLTERRISAISDEQTANTFRALPRKTRFQLHATQLQLLYAPNVLTPAAIRFSPVAVPNQPKSNRTDDLTFVARTDSAWRMLTLEEQQVLLAALSKKHEAFLGLAGNDSTSFALILAARQPDGSEKILAMRDRTGATRFAK